MLFTSSEYAWIWLVARVYLGIQWVEAGWHKMFDPSWMSGGQAVHDFWARIVIVPEQGRPAIAYDWYRQFIQFMLDNGWHVWFGKLIAVGETTVGIALLVGIFTGVAAFAGAVMNWNFMLSGTASVNPILGILGVGVLAAWKVAGWWGLDRIVLPLVGAPWQRGPILGGDEPVVAARRAERGRGVARWACVAVGGVLLGLSLAYLTGWAQVFVGIGAVGLMGASMIVPTSGRVGAS